MSQLLRIYTYDLLSPQSPISLSIAIGNGQAAKSILQLDGKTLLADVRDSFSFDDIQDPASLSGKMLDVFTTVTDVNPENDDVSFRLKLSGGKSTLHPPTERFRVSPSGYFQFITKVIFI